MNSERRNLLVKKLPPELDEADISSFLKHFGAEQVTVLKKNRALQNSALAVFVNEVSAQKALQRLHQLELLGTRLTAQYATTAHEQVGNREESWTTLNRPTNIKAKSKLENKVPAKVGDEKITKISDDSDQKGIAPKLGVKFDASPQLHYLYPPPNVTILTNVANAMATVPKFYTQVLHLMNKMCLPPPFSGPTPSPPLPGDSINLVEASTDTDGLEEFAMSSEESELESDSEERSAALFGAGPSPRVSKPVTKRRLKQSKYSLASAPKKRNTQFAATEVFEPSSQVTTKRIEFKLTASISAALDSSIKSGFPTNVNLQAPSQVEALDIFDGATKDEPEGFGVMKAPPKEESVPLPNSPMQDLTNSLLESPVSNGESSDSDNSSDEEDDNVISGRKLRENRVSAQEILEMPQFSKYVRGEPSNKLYVKNLHRHTDEKDLHFIFRRFLKGASEDEHSKFDVRVLKEGRMKGQAFVSFPSVDLASLALNATHGYLLHGRPIVIQFARSSKN